MKKKNRERSKVCEEKTTDGAIVVGPNLFLLITDTFFWEANQLRKFQTCGVKKSQNFHQNKIETLLYDHMNDNDLCGGRNLHSFSFVVTICKNSLQCGIAVENAKLFSGHNTRR